jgi:hypothetical protein
VRGAVLAPDLHARALGGALGIGNVFHRAPSVSVGVMARGHAGRLAAFVAAAPTAALAMSTSSWTCSRSVLQRGPSSRRASSPSLAPITRIRCAAPPASKENEEDVLDEIAMRAAEIHEVVTGLEEFKARIIDGESIQRIPAGRPVSLCPVGPCPRRALIEVVP